LKEDVKAKICHSCRSVIDSKNEMKTEKLKGSKKGRKPSYYTLLEEEEEEEEREGIHEKI
jgi:hypothetical protein